MTIREKLLAAIDPEDFRENVPDSVLLDLVLDQLSATKAALVASRNAILKEGMRADRAVEQAQQMRGAALKPPQGDFFFVSPGSSGPFFIVTIANGDVRLSRREGGIDYLMYRITRGEYLKRMENT